MRRVLLTTLTVLCRLAACRRSERDQGSGLVPPADAPANPAEPGQRSDRGAGSRLRGGHRRGRDSAGLDPEDPPRQPGAKPPRPPRPSRRQRRAADRRGRARSGARPPPMASCCASP
ncbi:MAG: hypothetical protein WDM92_12325 [Caulobacteraceae bacterium]